MPSSRARATLRKALTRAVFFALAAAAAAVIAAPVMLERAVEQVRFADHLGTFPVEVGLCHNGRSTLDTGLFGKVYWNETGSFGFGAYARSTGTPDSGQTLASYVDPTFIRANVEFIDDPDVVVDAYSAKFTEGIRAAFIRDELIAAFIGGVLILLLVSRPGGVSASASASTRTVSVVVVAALVAATATSSLLASRLFANWSCSQPVTGDLAMPGVSQLSFGSAATLEVARQIQPLIEKNAARIEARAASYRAGVETSFDEQLATRRDAVTPREGEVVVIAEADPQGSFVGASVRSSLYADLVEAVGDDAIALRTISGDVTSNGTVAESAYIDTEASVAEGIPVAAVGGDHDSELTWQQMADSGIDVPDLTTTELSGLRVSGANDREHKSLFGGLVSNDSGITEDELGAELRSVVDDEARIVLLHQPDAVAGYLGVDDIDVVRGLAGSATVPYDDGIPDQVPGTVNVGHLHVADGPWVLWNTDGDQVTWTVVDQLGTAGGVENSPTINRFSTPVSVPLKPLAFRLQFFNVETGLQTGYVTVSCDVSASCTVSERVDVGLPGGVPGEPLP